MGRDRYRFIDPAAPHFVTLTVLQWLPLFAQPAHVEILFGALRHHQQASGLVLYGYVIMEDHCHLLAQAPDLPKVLASFKSYTAKQIVNRLTELRSPVLDLLAMHKARHKTDRAHRYPHLCTEEDSLTESKGSTESTVSTEKCVGRAWGLCPTSAGTTVGHKQRARPTSRRNEPRMNANATRPSFSFAFFAALREKRQRRISASGMGFMSYIGGDN